VGEGVGWGGSVRLEAAELESAAAGIAKAELTLSAGVGASGGIEGTIEFNTDLFERGSVERLAGRLAVLAEALAAAPAEAEVWSLPLMSPAEEGQVLRTFNDTAAEYPTDLCIHDLVERQVQRSPDSIALEWQGDTMTYAELWDAAGKVGAWLVAHGVGADCVAALQLARSLEQVVGVLGVLRSGGAYLPLDPKWPLERRRFMMEDASCGWLVGQAAHVKEHASWFCGASLSLDNARCVPDAELQPGTASWQAAQGSSASLAYVIFTSGSTGTPKGVMVPHAGVVNLLHHIRTGRSFSGWGLARLDTEATRAAITCNYAFDWYQLLLFSCLGSHGGLCHLLSSSLDLLQLDSSAGVTCVGDVPSVISMANLPPSVKYVDVGGEALTQAVLDRVSADVELYNSYGPTEVTIDSLGCLVDVPSVHW
jgi:non-ribosomal peptide synthetase component F